MPLYRGSRTVSLSRSTWIALSRTSFSRGSSPLVCPSVVVPSPAWALSSWAATTAAGSSANCAAAPSTPSGAAATSAAARSAIGARLCSLSELKNPGYFIVSRLTFVPLLHSEGASGFVHSERRKPRICHADCWCLRRVVLTGARWGLHPRGPIIGQPHQSAVTQLCLCRLAVRYIRHASSWRTIRPLASSHSGHQAVRQVDLAPR